MKKYLRSILLVGTLLMISGPADAMSQASSVERLFEVLAKSEPAVDLKVEWEPADGSKTIRLHLVREDPNTFSLAFHSEDAEVQIVRTPEFCHLAVPSSGIVFRGKGSLDAKQTAFSIKEFMDRVLKLGPEFQGLSFWLRSGNVQAAKKMLKEFADVEIVDTEKETGQITLAETGTLRWNLKTEEEVERSVKTASPSNLEEIEVPRTELERSLLRAAVRLVGIEYEKWNPPLLVNGTTEDDHGILEIRDGQRIVTLWGAPREIGRQHGVFLKPEIRKVIDSTLYVVGLFYSVEKGEWFHDVLRENLRATRRHVPERYFEEIRGIAEGAHLDESEILLTTCFPELFHCSGFAVSGKATEKGHLYHGRVLDYMTGIGLQECAVVFVIAPEGEIPFANIGYAGLVGSVTGMNAQKVALGEMGGGGDGLWDGVPMTILMRMALEKANTLQQAVDLFQKAPRTCEYFYVFSDGKDHASVGVAAWPRKIDFIAPGTAHELLPLPQPDCVILSAGDRYTTLANRVKDQFGRIDLPRAIALMDAPVAMGDDNLHNVLFVPERLEFHVANARGSKPAYENPYYRYSLKKLLEKVPPSEEPVSEKAD